MTGVCVSRCRRFEVDDRTSMVSMRVGCSGCAHFGAAPYVHRCSFCSAKRVFEAVWDLDRAGLPARIEDVAAAAFGVDLHRRSPRKVTRANVALRFLEEETALLVRDGRLLWASTGFSVDEAVGEVLGFNSRIYFPAT